MAKQTKMIKFMLVVLILIPLALCVTGIVQTFVLKNTQAELANAKTNLEQSNNQYNELQDEYNYKTSDDYLNEYYKYNNGYSDNPDDVIIDIQ